MELYNILHSFIVLGFYSVITVIGFMKHVDPYSEGLFRGQPPVIVIHSAVSNITFHLPITVTP